MDFAHCNSPSTTAAFLHHGTQGKLSRRQRFLLPATAAIPKKDPGLCFAAGAATSTSALLTDREGDGFSFPCFGDIWTTPTESEFSPGDSESKGFLFPLPFLCDACTANLSPAGLDPDPGELARGGEGGGPATHDHPLSSLRHVTPLLTTSSLALALRCSARSTLSASLKARRISFSRLFLCSATAGASQRTAFPSRSFPAPSPAPTCASSDVSSLPVTLDDAVLVRTASSELVGGVITSGWPQPLRFPVKRCVVVLVVGVVCRCRGVPTLRDLGRCVFVAADAMGLCAPSSAATATAAAAAMDF
ncbi:hypothetical protein VTJ49DRAFT_768 [Mycothermus thermophilus]|uniref:Uncharacterized protein n=1 Tax=Humicola insolens TaxID=85995 RepID=A0ABR3VF66_HUMIN